MAHIVCESERAVLFGPCWPTCEFLVAMPVPCPLVGKNVPGLHMHLLFG